MTDRLDSEELGALAEQVLALAKQRGASLITAESCTAGLLASTLSEAPGAANRLHGGFVTYTKQNKTAVLGVPAPLLRERGAVCPEVAVAMAEGALVRSPADIAVAVTGVAGPERDEDDNPVGLVCIAVASKFQPTRVITQKYGDIGRDAVRARAITDALVQMQQVMATASHAEQKSG